MLLKDELKKYRTIIDEELEKILSFENTPQKKIFEAIRYSVFAGGKRLRPILTLKSCELICGNYKKALNFALAIEMIHTYSLIHDDLPAMDNDDFRRGKPTNHRIFGENMAILAGDGLLNLAYELMIDTISKERDTRRYILAFKEIAKASGIFGMIGGQVVDILSENKYIDKETVEFIHKNKTSALIEASIISGAIIGGASDNEIEHLRRYGRAIGLGYQIRDDILDKIGDISKLGKDIGSDEENNKATYLTLYGLEKSIKKTEELCNEAIEVIKLFKNNSNIEFFTELCKYLVSREN